MQLKQDNNPKMENFKILNEKENPLFNRKEIQVSVEVEITPSHADVEKLICEKFSTQIENIKIKKISGKFGSRTFTITANIYNSKEDLEKTEPKSKKKVEEKKQVEEAPKPTQDSQKESFDNSSNQSSEPASEQS